MLRLASLAPHPRTHRDRTNPRWAPASSICPLSFAVTLRSRTASTCRRPPTHPSLCRQGPFSDSSPRCPTAPLVSLMHDLAEGEAGDNSFGHPPIAARNRTGLPSSASPGHALGAILEGR